MPLALVHVVRPHVGQILRAVAAAEQVDVPVVRVDHL